ncbi:peptidylprolyl isomerase [Sphingobacterium sp. LRF_L2]|uniref:peptidylprolyl isomerase n=1 Tax=Sphingobacterium sp. LRF_L2 TaxID=3369421 RepID=UPI003F600376
MKAISSFFIALIITTTLNAQSHKLLFETDYGSFKVLLYDFTPKHRDLILEAIANDVYQDALFNRVIENFVVQGGEHDIDIERREALDPKGGKPRLAPEFDSRAFHKMGALGAGRDNNLEKASFLNQIYFVVGKPITNEMLKELEEKKGITYTNEQRKVYLDQGGQPRLDHDYTVFGEVYEGLNTLMKISQAKTDSADYPIKAIPFRIKEIKEE